MSSEDHQAGTIEYWAHAAPERIGLIEAERELTYAQWNDQANRLAEALSQTGLSRGDIVAVRTQIRLEWAVISSALAKLGCPLLGTNWRLTPAEMAYVLKNSGATALICDDPDPAQLSSALSELSVTLAVSMDTPATGFVDFAELLTAEPVTRYAEAEPELIIYTSGTTGLPKGVASRSAARALTDPRVAAYLQDVASSRSTATTDNTVLVTLPMHHAAGPAALAGALRRGSLAVLLRRFDAEAVLRLINRHKVNEWTGVPTMFKRISSLPDEVLARYNISSIKRLGVGAAPVTPELKDWIENYFGEGLLTEGYGSTETGMITFMPPGKHREKPGSSGKPHKHVEISIRDDAGDPVPPGDIGEIWVRTPVTITEYLNAGPLQADVLDADGFFRTGDVGQVDADGFLFITDRAKDMIISGGVNIYPAEIEAALTTHDAIQDAAVIGIPNPEFGEEVKAFIELKPGESVDQDEIRSYAAGRLASYKVPRSFDVVTELPKNTMGKVLKRELREPYWQAEERKV